MEFSLFFTGWNRDFFPRKRDLFWRSTPANERQRSAYRKSQGRKPNNRYAFTGLNVEKKEQTEQPQQQNGPAEKPKDWRRKILGIFQLDVHIHWRVQVSE